MTDSRDVDPWASLPEELRAKIEAYATEFDPRFSTARFAAARTALASALLPLLKDRERLDWLADDPPFDGFAKLDIHEIAGERFTDTEPTADEQRTAYRWAMRELIDRTREAKA